MSSCSLDSFIGSFLHLPTGMATSSPAMDTFPNANLAETFGNSISTYVPVEVNGVNLTPRTPKRKRLTSNELLQRPELTDTEYSLIVLMEEKMQLLNKLEKLDKLDLMEQNIRGLTETITTLKEDNKQLRGEYQCLQTTVDNLQKENDALTEAVIDLQLRSMSDNLIFHGIAEAANEKVDEVEGQVRAFFQYELQMERREAEKIIISRVHRLGKKKTYGEAAASAAPPSPTPPSPRPIIVKFGNFTQRQQVKFLGPKLKGKPAFGISEQYPKIVMERRRVLWHVYHEEKRRKNSVKMVGDRLYVNDKLFSHPAVTPWIKEEV